MYLYISYITLLYIKPYVYGNVAVPPPQVKVGLSLTVTVWQTGTTWSVSRYQHPEVPSKPETDENEIQFYILNMMDISPF